MTLWQYFHPSNQYYTEMTLKFLFQLHIKRKHTFLAEIPCLLFVEIEHFC
jgi:hypothetical protein